MDDIYVYVNRNVIKKRYLQMNGYDPNKKYYRPCV